MFDLSPPLSSPQTSESFSRFQVWLKTEPGSLGSNVSDEVRCPPVKTNTNHRIPGPAQMMNMSLMTSCSSETLSHPEVLSQQEEEPGGTAAP